MSDFHETMAEWLERQQGAPTTPLQDRALAAAEHTLGRPLDPRAQPASTGLPSADEARAARVAMFVETLPERFRGALLEHLAEPIDGGPPMDEDARDQIEDWVGWPDGRNLVMSGEVGTGKSYAAVAAIRERVARGDRAWWLPAKAFLALLRPDGDPRALERACTVPVLALDDLGEERRTEWTAEQVDTVVETRWNRELPIVATSNHKPGRSGTLMETLGERAHSRLVGTGAVVLHLTGPDRRGFSAKVPEPRPRGGRTP